MSNPTEQVRLKQLKDYQFEVSFGENIPVVLGDEPAPMGSGLGPSPVQFLAAAVGNCLSDSLLFALRKFKQAPEPIQCEVTAEVGRNAENRLRVLSMKAVITLGVPAAQLEHLDRVLSQFEAFCTVTQSVAQCIPVNIEIKDATGAKLK
jgi:uncharacterized OsmC-like protein